MYIFKMVLQRSMQIRFLCKRKFIHDKSILYYLQNPYSRWFEKDSCDLL